MGTIPRPVKRPGQFPPFALFSKEQRQKIIEANPDIGFTDIGRMLGEMWHQLNEEQKEDYRKRAKVIQEQKVRISDGMKTSVLIFLFYF